MKLIKLEVNDFKKINNHAPVVITFDTNFVTLNGDNKVGKTSLEEALLVALGHLPKDNPDYLNRDSGKLDINLEFKGNDRLTYRVRVTKSQFKLEYEGENLPEPITKVKELLGIPGVSPMDIKNRPLKDIVKWLSSYTASGADSFEKRLNKLKVDIKSSAAARAEANKIAKGLREYLNNEQMYHDWEKSEERFKKKVSVSELSARLDEARKKADKLVHAEAKMKQLVDREAALVAELEEVRKGIDGGKKFIEQNKNAQKEYEQVRKQYDVAAQEVVGYEKWQDIKRKKDELDTAESLSQAADAAEKELIEKRKEIEAEIIPDVRGLNLVLDDEYDNGKLIKPEGLYWNGINAAQMSESEWWAICMKIWAKNNVKIIVIDNFQSLGSMAVENLQRLAKQGAYIFAAQMERGKKDLEIIYQ